MKKLFAIVLAVSMLGSGCCTVTAVSYGQTWATPVTVPVDVVLLPVEIVGIEVWGRILTGGKYGGLAIIAPFGDAK